MSTPRARSTAKQALDQARTPNDPAAVSTALEDGRFSMECVRASGHRLVGNHGLGVSGLLPGILIGTMLRGTMSPG